MSPHESTRNDSSASRHVLLNLSLSILLLISIVAGLLYFATEMPGESYAGQLPELTPELSILSGSLQAHVRVLADDIGERNYTKMEELHQSADYIERQFEAYGYVPSTQVYGDKQYRNVVVEIHGRQLREEIIVVGAHYDTSWITPGADDNASGVAGLLEIARLLRDKSLARTIRLIAFTNEEMPFFRTDEMGSRVTARRSYDRKENIIGMFSLEMIGYYRTEAHSQFYPRIIRRFYPDTGNFIAFVTNISSRTFMHKAIGAFRERGQFPSEGLAVPEWLIPDIRRSDNSSYWFYTFPAVMVTDTANFRNRNYHRAGDTYDTLNYEYMARVVHGLAVMLEDLAQE